MYSFLKTFEIMEQWSKLKSDAYFFVTPVKLGVNTIFQLKWEALSSKKQNMHGAACLKKKRQNSPLIRMHSASTVRKKGNFVFRDIFQKCS